MKNKSLINDLWGKLNFSNIKSESNSENSQIKEAALFQVRPSNLGQSFLFQKQSMFGGLFGNPSLNPHK